MTIGEALGHAAEALRPAAQEEAGQQARLLFAHVLQVEPKQLVQHLQKPYAAELKNVVEPLVARRLKREPLQYILGEWAFMGLAFTMRPNVLIPRQDTETLAEAALALARERGYRTALDLCCGSGCIGIALAKLGGLAVTAVDISEDCVALTKENAARNGVNITVLQGGWFAPVTGTFDMILCNPPYLTEEEMLRLQPEVRYEPALALYGGEDGLDAYRLLQREYKAYIQTGGVMLLETGYLQARAVAALFYEDGVKTLRDLNGIERVVCIRPTMETDLC